MAKLAPDPGEIVPETYGYRLKRSLLGPPLTRDQLSEQRLGKPTALAVLSSDVMSSSAYATEQILVVLVPAVGLAAFSLVVPLTIAIIGVLAVVTLLYRQVVAAYPKAGGAYVVSRENFGPKTAQLAGASLLIDYTLTVAVSVAAGTAAITSASPALARYSTIIAIGFVLILAYGNLRGIREAGRSFAIPTFLFIANVALLVVVGIVRDLTGHLVVHSIHQAGAFAPGRPGGGLFQGASLFFILKAYASGGSALTGTEAISNGVSVFRDPQARNARSTLVAMALILGSMFLGISFFAAITHPVPYLSGTPTVISQVAKYVYGTTALGHVLYIAMQLATAAILVLAANTSFTGFPILASFAAEDSFLPHQLMRRGHRLVFSNGIIVLTVVAVGLLLATGSNLNALIALYAIGVFTGFTLSGAGMVKHHWVGRGRGWRRSLVICATAAVLSFIVDLVFVVTKFTEGAWVVVVLLPLLMLVFTRLHSVYNQESEVLETGAQRAAEAPVLRRHVVMVLVDRMDLATARAIQYARTLYPDDLRAVHFVIDFAHAQELAEQWTRLGLSKLRLELIDCPDRRLFRSAVELVSEAVADGDTAASVLIPRRTYRRVWTRFLHDRTADGIVAAISQVPRVNATIVPFDVEAQTARARIMRLATAAQAARPTRPAGEPPASRRADRDRRPGRDLSGITDVSQVSDCVPMADLQPRQRVKVAGRVRSLTVQPYAGTPSLQATLTDGTGRVVLTFSGRRRIPGIEPGTRLKAEGTVSAERGRLAILNPDVELLGPSETGGVA